MYNSRLGQSALVWDAGMLVAFNYAVKMISFVYKKVDSTKDKYRGYNNHDSTIHGFKFPLFPKLFILHEKKEINCENLMKLNVFV